MLIESDRGKIERFFATRVEILDERTEFRSAAVLSLCRWWFSRGEGVAPAFSDFDILDHARVASRLFLVGVLGDGGYETRLMGEEAIRMIGENRKGKVIARNDENLHAQALVEYYDALAADRRGRKLAGRMDFAQRGHVHYESADLPFRGEGGAVTRIVGILDLVDPSAPVHRLLPTGSG